MKIAIDVSPLRTGNYLSHRVRGTGFYLTNLMQNLKKYYPENEYIEFVSEDGIPKADVVHFPYFELFFNTLPGKMPENSIVTVHDLTPLVFPDNFPAGIRGKLKWLGQKNKLRKSSAIITDSIASKNDITKYTGINPSKIEVIYLAASEEYKPIAKGEWEKEFREQYSLPEKFALYVGDATWNKNLPNMIKAVTQAKISLVIVGEAFKNEDIDKSNPWTSDLSQAQSLAKDNPNIISVGFVPSGDLVKFYNTAQFLLMPSRYEGFGLPLVEAMQSGCPVITSNRGSIKEIAGDSALYVNPENVNSVKDGIEKLNKGSSLCSELSKKGVSVARNFSWEKTAESTMNVYRKVFEND